MSSPRIRPSTVPSTVSSTAPNSARGRIKELLYPVLPGVQGGDWAKDALSKERFASGPDRRAMAPLLSRAVAVEFGELERAWGTGADARVVAAGSKRRLETLVVASLKRLCVKPVRFCTQRALTPDLGLGGSSSQSDVEARCSQLEAEIAAREQHILKLKAGPPQALGLDDPHAALDELAQRLTAEGGGAEAAGVGGGAGTREVLGLLERTLQRSIIVEDFVRESSGRLRQAHDAADERERAAGEAAWAHLPARRPDALLSLARMP